MWSSAYTCAGQPLEKIVHPEHLPKKADLVVYGISILLVWTSPTLAQPQTVAGVVIDSIRGEAINGATIELVSSDSVANGKDLVRRTISSKSGFFALPLIDPGTYYLKVTHVGYQVFAGSLTLSENDQSERLALALLPREIRLGDIVAYGNVTGSRDAPPGTTYLSLEVIRRAPTLGGEPDFLRTVQLLPGVKSASEFSNGLYIRGGSPDQNLNLLDGVMVYDPTHLGGFLGAFNSDAVKDVHLVKGAFPAEYGRRLSSVLDITMRSGTREKVSGIVGLSTLSARLLLEGPIGEKTTFMLSGRRMYFDLLYPLINDSRGLEDYGFYDLNGKVTTNLSENDKLSIGAFYSDDIAYQPPWSGEVWFDITWKNATGGIRWEHIFSSRFLGSLSLHHTGYYFDGRVIKGGQPSTFSDFVSKSRINDYGLEAGLQWFVAPAHTLSAGAEFTYHEFRFAARDVGFSTGEVTTNETIVDAAELSLYLQDDWTLADDLSANLGVRAYYYLLGEYFRAEPRFMMAFALSENTRLKAAASVAHQFVHLIVRNDISVPTGIWFPTTKTTLPGRSLQGSLAFEWEFGRGKYFLSLETFYKDMQDLYEYREGADLVSGSSLEEQFTRGSGNAYGVELFVNRRIGSLTGWAGYTLSWTKRLFSGLNGGREFYPAHDRRHDVSILLSYTPDPAWELSATWKYSSGQAYSGATGVYFYPGMPGVSPQGISLDYAERNAYRLPPFHKLDISVAWRFQLVNLAWQLSLAVYNVYNRSNVYAEYVSYEGTSPVQVQPKVTQVSLFSITPTVGLTVSF